MKNVLVVSNYNAGRKQALMQKKLLHKFLLKRCQKFKFISIDEFDEIDLKEFDTVFAMGGDGTVNKIVKKIIKDDAEIILGIIPCGTANLLAAKLGLSINIKNNLKIIEKNKTKAIDVLDINGQLSILRCGFGYDPEIICKTPQSLKNKFGYFAYFISGILFALRLKVKNYQILIDEKEIKLDASCLIIANSANMYRNFISIANDCELDDEIFEVFALKAVNPITFFYEFLKIIFGIKKDNSRAKYLKAKFLLIKNHWSACHIDGEKTKLKDDILVKIISNKIKVFCR